MSRIPLHVQVLVGAAAGILVGVVVGEPAALLQPVADLFVKLLRMIIAPMVFLTLSVAILGQGAGAMSGIGLRAVAYNLATLAVALGIGIGFGVALAPGAGMDAATREALQASGTAPAVAGETQSAFEILSGIVPGNVFSAFVEGNVLQILFLAILFGGAVRAVGPARLQGLVDVTQGLHDLVYRVVHWVVRLAPVGVFAILAAVVGASGLGILGALAWYVAVVFLATFAHVSLVHCGAVRLLAGQPLGRFFRALREPLPIAFASVSTAAALPVSMVSVPRETGISERAAGFVLPLGAAVGRDSSGIYQVVSVLCIAQLASQPLAGPELLILWGTAILTSLAVAGAPGASFVNLAILLEAVGLPVPLAALIFAVERPLDHLRTSGNLIGQFANAVFTGATGGEMRRADAA